MRVFLSLLKVTVLSHFSISVMQETFFEQKRRQWELVLTVLGLLLGGGMISGAIFTGANALFRFLPPFLAEVVLTGAVLAVQVMSLVFGLVNLISLFYFSADLSLLVPLPVKEWTILAAKYVVAAMTEYIAPLVLLLPVLFAYNRHMPLGWAGVLMALAVFLLLPFVPLSLAGIVTLTLMRGIGRRHRDILVVVGSLLIVAVSLAFQYLTQAMAAGELDIIALLQGRVDLVARIGAFFPPSIWATRAISRAGEIDGLVSLLYLGLASLAAVGIFVLVGQMVFYGGLVGGEEKKRRRKELTRGELASVKRQPALYALTVRELRLFSRMPIWVLNAFLVVAIVPLMAFFPGMMNGGEVNPLSPLLQAGTQGETVAILIFATLIAALSSINAVAGTALTREGRHLWISKAIPVAPVLQVTAKLLMALLCTMLVGVLLMALFVFLLAPSLSSVLLAFVLGVAASIAPQALGLAFDLWRPFLTWTTPQHAVKNNLNAVMPLFFVILLGLANYFVYLWLSHPLGTLFLPVLLGLHLAAAGASVYFVLTRAQRFYDKLEVKA